MNNIIDLSTGVKICVFGDCHEHPQHLQKLIEKVCPSPEMILVSVGDFKDKGEGEQAFFSMTQHMMQLHQEGMAYAVKGNHELKMLNHYKKKKNEELVPEVLWWRQRPLSLQFKFCNDYFVRVLHAGVTPHHTLDDLLYDQEICYVRTVDEEGYMIPLIWKQVEGVRTLIPAKEHGTIWHEVYDGRFGYIVSGHDAQKDGIPKYYKYSCNLDTGVYETGILTAQIFSEQGLEDRITITL